MGGLLVFILVLATWLGIGLVLKRRTSSNVVAFGGGFILCLLGFAVIGSIRVTIQERQTQNLATVAGFATVEQHRQAQEGGFETKADVDRAIALRAEEEQRRKAESAAARRRQQSETRRTSTSTAAQDTYGMSRAQFDQCRALGSNVMAAQRRQPDSREHKAAYDAWDQSCGMAVMLNVYRQTGISLRSLPTTPLEWSRL